MGKTASRTEKDTNAGDRFFGSHHYVTKISDGSDEVEARGSTSEESQQRASEKWAKK